MPTVLTSGSQTATISTEHSLATVSTDEVIVLTASLANMVNGDVVELRIYGKVRSTDGEELLYRGTYGPGKPNPTMVQSVPVTSPHHCRATLKQTAGTGRAFVWALYGL